MSTAPIEAWQRAWREGFLPSISDAGLLALRDALVADDPRLIQGANTEPPPLNLRPDETPRAACAVCLTRWLGDGVNSVAAIEEFFARSCFDADFRLGEPTACRRFLNWFDSTPRMDMRRLMLAEVLVNLVARGVAVPAA